MLNVENAPIYLPDEAWTNLVDRLHEARHDIDPRNAITIILGEIGNIWPAIVLSDPART